MKARRVLMMLALAAVPFIAGCHCCDKCDDDDKKASMGAVNSVCPMRGAACPIGDKAATTSFKGKTVAFCCKGCISKWDALSDSDKQARLDKATRQAASPQ